MSIVIREFKNFKKETVLLILSVFFFSACAMIIPMLFANLVDEGIPQKDVGLIVRDSGIMLFLAVVQIGLGLLISASISTISMGIGRNLSKAVFDKVQAFSQQEIDSFSISSLISRTNNDIYQIKLFFSQCLMMLIMAPFMCIIGLALAIATSPELSIVLFVAIPVLVIILVILVKITLPMSIEIQNKTDDINLITREKLTGARVIRAFGTQDFERERFARTNADYCKTNKKVQNISSLLLPVSVIILALSVGGILLLAYLGVKNGTHSYTTGIVLAEIEYVLFIMASIIMMTFVFLSLPMASSCAKRTKEVLDSESLISNPENPKDEPEMKGYLEYKNVSFTYAGAEAPAVNNLSFTSKPGEITAIIGGTGMGKSSIINLIPRLYDVTSGQILIDGIDIRDYDIEVLRKKIGFVPQKAMLFSGTIDSNIRFGDDDPTDERVEKAVKIAQSYDFVTGKDEGFEAPVAEGGGNFSGGQKQRLCIARAIVRKPEIYVFDDSFSALDFKTDKALRTALKEETDNATTLIVAQRISTIMDADRIIVIDCGNIMGIGTHKELMKNCPVYRQIAESQLSEEELKNA